MHITSYKQTAKWPSILTSFNGCCDRKYYNHSTTKIQLKERYLNCFTKWPSILTTSYKQTAKWPSILTSFNGCCDRKYYNHSTTNIQLKERYLNCFNLQMSHIFLCTNQHTHKPQPVMYTRAANHTQFFLLFHLQNVLASLSHCQGVSQI